LSRHVHAAPTLARVLGVWLVLASVCAEAQDTPPLQAGEPAPPSSTDTAPQARSPEVAPLAAQSELTLEGGVAALNDGRYAEAAAALEHAIAAQGESARLYALLGRARLLAREYGAAQVALRRATQLEPEVAKYWLWFGHTLRAGGDMTSARKAYRNVLALAPGSPQAQAALRELPAERPAAASQLRRRDKTTASDAARRLPLSDSSIATPRTPAEELRALQIERAHTNLALPTTITVLGSVTAALGFMMIPMSGLCAIGDTPDACRNESEIQTGGAVVGLLSAGAVMAALVWREIVKSKRKRLDSRIDELRTKLDAAAGLAWRVYAAPTASRDGMVAGVSGRM